MAPIKKSGRNSACHEAGYAQSRVANELQERGSRLQPLVAVVPEKGFQHGSELSQLFALPGDISGCPLLFSMGAAGESVGQFVKDEGSW